ncbi:MAG: SDR family NAD(P)-dependent oxidoreductase [Saccharothrix sp.]|nr:SDR family NAD(P)-dependent oxidoreductase [Saccharothrix sp.]
MSENALREAVAGRTVLITGASGPVGAETIRRLVRAGATIIATSRSARGLDSAGGSVSTFAADLTRAESVEALARHVLSHHGPVDVLVNAANRRPARHLPTPLHKADDLRAVIAVNVTGPSRLLSALAPTMRTRANPHIVNLSHLGARIPLARLCNDFYSAKAAFDTWSSGPDTAGITVTTVYLALLRSTGPRWLNLTAEEAAGMVCEAIVARSSAIPPWQIRRPSP